MFSPRAWKYKVPLFLSSSFSPHSSISCTKTMKQWNYGVCSRVSKRLEWKRQWCVACSESNKQAAYDLAVSNEKVAKSKDEKTRRIHRDLACVRDDDFALRHTKIETSTERTCVKVHVLRLLKVLCIVHRHGNDECPDGKTIEDYYHVALNYPLNQTIPFILTFGRDHLTIL
jgi:hypothetical protein